MYVRFVQDQVVGAATGADLFASMKPAAVDCMASASWMADGVSHDFLTAAAIFTGYA